MIAFDLEGPLTPQDYACELFEDVVPEGGTIFAALSRYDDALAERQRDGCEPGDTLALILPFILAHGADFAMMKKHIVSHISVAEGAVETFDQCRRAGRIIHVITTAYEPFALEVCRILGVDPESVHPTRVHAETWQSLDLPDAHSAIVSMESSLRERFQSTDLGLGGSDDELIDLLDPFFLERLPTFGLPHPTSIVQPRGGRRKLECLKTIAREARIPMSDVVYVGDSITDEAALRFVDKAGGLSIAFNGNRFAIRAATVAVASRSTADLLPLLDAWDVGGRPAVRAVLDSKGLGGDVDAVWLPGLSNTDVGHTVERHARTRSAVREGAARLG
ncbi:MAG: hypothetical protein M3256_07390 [Actinomycetota bacterium]|nr:hypothetical protein [Actinomycetota bacterium]